MKNEKQQLNQWIYFNPSPYMYQGKEMIHCPMCEDAHENNSQCQRNDFND